jgi:hypothetical protein
MATLTNAATATTTTKAAPANAAAPFSLAMIVDTLLCVNLREKLDADTGGDKSDGAYTYGL